MPPHLLISVISSTFLVLVAIPKARGQDTLSPEKTNTKSSLQAGQGIVDITPPIGTQFGGYLDPNKERLIQGIRQPAKARCLVLKVGQTLFALVSLDMLAVSKEMTERVQQAAKKTGIPPENIRICVTHTHSMPTLKPLRFYGEVPKKYQDNVEKKIVIAIQKAKEDLAPATLHLGIARAVGAAFNRTSKVWKTDKHFGKTSTDADRWLDTSVHVLQFQRKGKSNLLWYHFSAHPVCYRDAKKAGPDWDGHVTKLVKRKYGITPSFLQGHCGDVNSGDGKTFLGNPEEVGNRVFAAIEKALKDKKSVPVSEMGTISTEIKLPLDMKLFQKWAAHYESDPEKLGRGWFNKSFARNWYESRAKWNSRPPYFPMPVTVLHLEKVAILFHAGELYSAYGLIIRRDSPFSHTIVVGYADDLVGYLCDPRAYQRQEYGAIAVPKIIDIPPFTPTDTSVFAKGAVQLLRKVKDQ